MQTHRFLLKPEEISKDTFKTSNPEIVNKAVRVLRLMPGAQIEVFNGQGSLFRAQIDTISEDSFEGSILQEVPSPEHKSIQLILAQGLPKGSKLDDIIRMNTEVGVSEFVLFESQNSIVKSNHFQKNKLERLNKIAEEASRQSERVIVPQITGPITFNEMLKFPADFKLLLHSRIVDRTINIKDLDLKGTILAVVGPEGGFTAEEIEAARDNEFAVIHMDLSILRTETAGIVASAILLS